MERKKIAFFLPYLIIGGIERLYVIYANSLTKYYDVTMIVCSAEGAYKKDLSKNVKIIELSCKRIRFSLFELIKVLRRKRFDYLIGSNLLANIIMLLASFFVFKTKFIVAQHNYMNVENTHVGYYARFSEFYMKILYPCASKVIAVSQGIKQYLIDKIGLSEGKVEIVYNSIDVNHTISKSGEKVEIPFENFIVFVGRLSKVKNLPFLFRSFDKTNNSDIKLLIIGDGPYEDEIKRAAKQAKKEKDIVFLGALDNPMPYIKKAKALVLPSLSESFGMVLLEALSLNTPVVSTPTKGALEVLEGVDGAFLTNTFNNEVEFADKINAAIIFDRTKIRYPNKFSIESSIKSIKEMLDSLS